ncbi:MAG: SDR family NAD(P)-dependent oxidoreductase [Roseburia sp.]|nr:SDR family NAD(P)-dependent oxidoreductase [Roseburia sp.]MCM1242949.1 SDR family NAD(P)-dependent oxidoreductase [Roseburia sp.]
MNIAIITGASSGMGREFAKRLAASLSRTDEIWLLARRRNALEELASELAKGRRGHALKIRTIVIDITDERKLAHFVEVLMIRNAGISVLVNCAGMGIYGAFEAQSRDEITETVRLNVLALTQMTKFCLPYMKSGSRIIQVSSGSAFLPQADFAVYAATKAYVYSFGQALHKELKPKGISVTTVCPGPVKTPFLDHAYGRYGQMNLLKKLTMARPEKVVKKALKDSKKKKALSIYGLPMKLLYLTTKGIV